MAAAEGWTGRTACALQAAMRLSHEAFAQHLGVSARTIAGWHQKPTARPQSEIQQLLDTALDRAAPAVKARFAELTGEKAAPSSDAEHRLSADPNISAALHWLDLHAGWEPGTARRDVAARLDASTCANSRTEAPAAAASTNAR